MKKSITNSRKNNVELILSSLQKQIEMLTFFSINTNEIQGELWHEYLISSHVKITSYLHMITVAMAT